MSIATSSKIKGFRLNMDDFALGKFGYVCGAGASIHIFFIALISYWESGNALDRLYKYYGGVAKPKQWISP